MRRPSTEGTIRALEPYLRFGNDTAESTGNDCAKQRVATILVHDERDSFFETGRIVGESMRGKSISRVFAWFLVISSIISLPAHALTWNFLGNKKIDGTRDHEKLEIRRHTGAFRAIQLRVTGEAIFFDRIVVHFEDGKSEELAVGSRIGPDGSAKVIALSGESRAVESVELWYYTERWESNPTVTLYGS